MSEQGLRILYIGGNAADEAAMRERLAAAAGGHLLTRIEPAAAALTLKHARWDLVLADARVPELSSGGLVTLLQGSGQEVPVVVVGDETQEARTVAWLEAGAFDFVTRPKFLGLWPVVARVQRDWSAREHRRAGEMRQRVSTTALRGLAKSRTFDGQDFDAALKEILEAGTVGADALVAGIWSFDRSAGVLRNLQQIDRRDDTWSSGFELKFSDFPKYFRALEEEQQIVAHDAHLDPRTAALARAYLMPKRVSSLLDTGVRIGGALRGIICLEHGSAGREWSADDQVFAAALAEVTALVFEGVDRRHAQQRADENEDRFLELFHHSRDSIVFYKVDAAGQLLAEDLNPASLELIGQPRERLVGRAPSDIVSKEAAELMMDRHEEVLKLRRAVVYEQRVTLPRGVAWFNTALVPFFDREGRVHRIAAIARNVTEQRVLEQQLAHSRTLEALGQLAGHIAHDFNNLLVGVSAWAGRLTRHVDADAREAGDQILQAAMRARELTREVLTFGQRELPTRTALNLTVVVKEAVALLKPSLPAQVHVHAELQAEGTTLLGDASQLHRVVLNLCTNALQSMKGGGRLALRLGQVEVSSEFALAHPPLRAGPHLRLEVEDTGHGMSPQVMARVFEPFFTTKGPGIGSGLGLSVVHGIVLAHGGAVNVSSQPGAGSTFEVFLPSLSSVPADLQTPGHGERLMVVDDQLNVARASAILFEQLGYHTTVFTDPREALAAFVEGPGQFDLVVTDLSMPQLSGVELATAVHALRADLPVIVTSGRALTAADRLELGKHVVLQKPWRLEDAVAALKSALAE